PSEQTGTPARKKSASRNGGMAALKGRSTDRFPTRWSGLPTRWLAPVNNRRAACQAAPQAQAVPLGLGRCDARCGSWGDFWCGDKFLLRFGLRGWREILCRKQVDHLGASGEAAELDVDAGIGQRQDGITEL